MPSITCTDPRDAELLHGLLANDRQRVGALYDEVMPHVHRYLVRAGAPPDTARDLGQEALVALFRRLRKTEPFALTCRLSSYLQAVARNLWLKQLRDRRDAAPLPETREPVDLDADVVANLERGAREGLLWRHLRALEAGCQTILRGFFAGTPLRAIAEQLGTSEGYVKKRKFVCKQRLVAAVQADPLFTELRLDDPAAA